MVVLVSRRHGLGAARVHPHGRDLRAARAAAHPAEPVYGFKTRFTRSDPRVWYDANAFVGRLMTAASIASAAILMWSPLPRGEIWLPAAIVCGPILLVTLAGLVYLRHLKESAGRR